jgi:hypothetical protein
MTGRRVVSLAMRTAVRVDGISVMMILWRGGVIYLSQLTCHPNLDRTLAMRLRFSIRDLFWLTLVMALAVGWWVNRRQIISKYDATIAQCQFSLKEMGELYHQQQIKHTQELKQRTAELVMKIRDERDANAYPSSPGH